MRTQALKKQEFSRLTWSTGFVTTLLMPLVILLVAHGVLHIPLRNSQGSVIFLFFIWVTSSQAILTLTRLRAVASWKVSAAMLMTLLFVVFIYLFAVESFTAFLYPNPEEVASYFQAAALPSWLFDGHHHRNDLADHSRAGSISMPKPMAGRCGCRTGWKAFGSVCMSCS